MDPELPVTPETSNQLRSLRSFLLHFPRQVAERNELIELLLQMASEAFVWPQPRSDKLRLYPSEFVTPERGRFRIEVSKAIIPGFGPFWHLNERGSIALRATQLNRGLHNIFKRCPLGPGCTAPSVFSSRNMLKRGDSPGAIRYCDKVVESGEYAFLLPVGTQYVSLFAPELELVRLYHSAYMHCRPWNCSNAYFTLSESHLYGG